jgi:hypothetical protein
LRIQQTKESSGITVQGGEVMRKGKRNAVRLASFVLVVVALAGMVSAGSQARPSGAGETLYKLTGTLSVVNKTNTWSMSGKLSLIHSTGGTPKTATFSAGGKLGAASVPDDPCTLTATTGRLKVWWPNGQSSTATMTHLMTHPIHTFAGAVGFGYRRNAVVIIWLQHKSNNAVAGQVSVIGPED